VQAAYAVREGLPREAALRAITETPAIIYGLGERVGSLAPGRDGDVVIWSGDPFDAQSRVERVDIDGREVHARLSVEDDTDDTHHIQETHDTHEGGRT
jgi:imidazolonepropionase-like amidohydrolase